MILVSFFKYPAPVLFLVRVLFFFKNYLISSLSNQQKKVTRVQTFQVGMSFLLR